MMYLPHQAVFLHYEGGEVFKSKETLAAQLRIAAVLLRKTGRSRPLFADTMRFVLREGSRADEECFLLQRTE